MTDPAQIAKSLSAGFNWLSIEGAPTDGTRVYLKRVYEGGIVTEGWGVFGIMADNAPMRFNDETEIADNEYADTPRWLREDRLHSFPAPTHFAILVKETP